MAKKFDLARLLPAMNRDRLALRRYREDRVDTVRRLIGAHPYDEHEARKIRPVNLTSFYMNVVGRQLCAKNPRLLLSTFDRHQRPAISTMQSWANSELDKMKFYKTQQRIVNDALMGLGIAMVSLATPADASMTGWNKHAGQAGIYRVDLDDACMDMHARDSEEFSYAAHRSRVPLEVIRDSTMYSKERKNLEPSYDSPYNLEGDERINLLGRGMFATNTEEFIEYVDIWTVWVPSHRLILTLADEQLGGPSASGSGENVSKLKPLREVSWIGPECGPYHYLGYQIVPGNWFPKGPVQDLVDLDDEVNTIFRKLFRQADRQKDNTWISGGASEDGDRVMKAIDGEIYKVNNPDQIKQTSTGGPNQNNFLFGQYLYELFSEMGGNVKMMAGSAPQSRTLGQDEMLHGASVAQIASMQEETVRFTSQVCDALLWYWWHDPKKVMRVKHQPQGLPDITINRQLAPQDRQKVRYEDIEKRIQPYSMQSKTPEQMLQFLDQRLQVMQPFLQVMQQQGDMPDFNFYLSKAAEYGDCPDLIQLFRIQEPPKTEDGTNEPPSAQGAGKPPETTRNYVRRSVGGDNSPMAQQAALRNKLMAAGGQNGAPQPMGAQ